MASQAEATGMPCSWVWRIESTAKPNFQFALDTLLDEKGLDQFASKEHNLIYSYVIHNNITSKYIYIYILHYIYIYYI